MKYKAVDICVICFWCELTITTVALEPKDTIEWSPNDISRLCKSATAHKDCPERPNEDEVRNRARLLAN